MVPLRQRFSRAAAIGLALATALIALAAACGGSGPQADPVEPEPTGGAGSGYFVGKHPDGLGVAVDLHGEDAVTRVVRGPLMAAGVRPEPVSIAVVSIINNGSRSQPLPAFIAVTDRGGATPLTPLRALAGGIAPLARAAPVPPLFVPAGRTATVYVVLAGVPPEQVDHLKLVLRPSDAVRLDSRAR
jgi:hypothetical protein